MVSRALLIAVLTAGCEFSHFIRREVPVQLASDDCIRIALRQINEISNIREVSNQGTLVFYWEARRGEEWTSGWLARERTGLVLETGHMNGYPCAGIVWGKAIMASIFEQLRATCSRMPDANSIHETCEGFGNCDCPSDGGFR